MSNTGRNEGFTVNSGIDALVRNQSYWNYPKSTCSLVDFTQSDDILTIIFEDEGIQLLKELIYPAKV